MDEGLDIDALRCALALHAGFCADPLPLAAALTLVWAARGAGHGPAALERLASRCASRAGRSPDWRAAEAALSWRAADRNILTMPDPAYPFLLRQIANPPPVLFVWGNAGCLASPQVAIVGARRATPGACEFARHLAFCLSRADVVVTSGLARGVDAAAHEGALAAGTATIAVSGCGCDRVYPAAHTSLARNIAASGAVISEFPLGTPPLRQNFPQRNRIVSGLCLGIVVVEADLRSGSLITARLAGDQGREVCAVPGSVRNPATRGCHALIKEGAWLVENPEDVLRCLGRDSTADPGRASLPARDASTAGLTRGKRLIMQALGYDPASPDELQLRSGLTMDRVSSILMELELEGHVRLLPGGLYERAAAGGPPERVPEPSTRSAG